MFVLRVLGRRLLRPLLFFGGIRASDFNELHLNSVLCVLSCFDGFRTTCLGLCSVLLCGLGFRNTAEVPCSGVQIK